jgi:acyl-CoA dehydrogenase
VPGRGFAQLMTQLPWERLSIALRSVGQCEFALAETLAYARERQLFGGKLLDQQNTQFVLAEVATMVEAMRSLVMSCLDSLREEKLGVARAAMAKLFCAQMANRVADACLQLFGGYGYMNEYPIGRFFCDARALKLYGGTDEVMKTIIARSLIAGKG